MKKYLIHVSSLSLCVFFGLEAIRAQQPHCFPDKLTTATYAEGGASPYIKDVLWLTWGSTDKSSNSYGEHGIKLTNGSGSYASILLGNGKYLCVEAVITNIPANNEIYSYAPGNYGGDSMDDMYNIGGTESDNKLVNGIQTSGQVASFSVTCRAWLDSKPVRLAGLVLGDAESLNGTGEFFHVTADGTWTVVELKKNLSNAGTYEVEKNNENGTTRQQIYFHKGNNDNTAAVSFLTFNSTAYGLADDDYAVSFDVTLNGGGITAIALGLLTINADGGDAPESYGAPLHLFEGMTLTDDGIEADGGRVNLNHVDYKPGSLESIPSTYLGSTGPDHDAAPLYSKDARGDDDEPIPSDEEDAWPNEYKRFSYKATYMPGDIIRAEIPYRGTTSGYIAGWIDFNLNGKFDEDEFTIKSVPARPSGDTVTLEWTVPSNRVPYSTYVRLRYGPNQDEVSSPISVATGGEVEDHRIYIFGPAIANPMLPSKAKRSQN